MNQPFAHDAERPDDIFTLDAPAKEAKQSALTGIAPNPVPSSANKSILDRIANLKTIHLVIIVCAGLLGALAWTHMAHRRASTSPGEAQYIDVNAAVETPPASQPPKPAPPAARVPARPATPTISNEQSVVPVPGENGAGAEPGADNDRAMIRTALENLNARLNAVENQTAVQAQKASPPAGDKTNNPGHRRPRHAIHAPLEPVDGKSLASLAGYSLNTIFNDQAWIDHDGRTYVVQPGDRIGAVRIIRIDARARRVLTSDGAIK